MERLKDEAVLLALAQKVMIARACLVFHQWRVIQGLDLSTTVLQQRKPS